jgi:cell division protein FtsZ
MTEVPFLPEPPQLPGASIKVVGVGGAGCNAINRMIEAGVQGVQFIALNTDQQSLSQSKAHVRLALGPQLSRGLGAGGDAEKGANAAEESRDEILGLLQGADMVFITAGMGGGTGTGAAPQIASFAKELGALTVAVVLTPFHWEGPGKMTNAQEGLDRLRTTADTLIVVSNEKLKSLCERGFKFKEAFKVADGVLLQGVRGITDLILRPGTLNGDFADVRAVLFESGEALIGTGADRGDQGILEALKKALSSPLLDHAAHGPATQVIVSIMADWEQVDLSAVETAMNFLSDHYQGVANIKLCQVEAPELEDRVLVTILASGFQAGAEPVYRPYNTREALAAEAAAHGEHAQPHNGPSGRVYGEIPSGPLAGPAPGGMEAPHPTPTRLISQPPTPSGEVASYAEDLHVPAIIRLTQGRLPIE